MDVQSQGFPVTRVINPWESKAVKWLYLFCVVVLLSACQSSPGSVAQKVMADFGIGEHPEGYVSGSDKVYEQLESVAKTEIKRMNAAGRHGEIKYEGEGLRGRYYKEVKVYESYYPLDVKAVSGGTSRDRGYVGLIEYRYRIMKGAEHTTRAAASAESASVPTDVEGRETYRYTFTMNGIWDGAPGERARR